MRIFLWILLTLAVTVMATRPPLGDYQEAKINLLRYGENLVFFTHFSLASVALVVALFALGMPLNAVVLIATTALTFLVIAYAATQEVRRHIIENIIDMQHRSTRLALERAEIAAVKESLQCCYVPILIFVLMPLSRLLVAHDISWFFYNILEQSKQAKQLPLHCVLPCKPE